MTEERIGVHLPPRADPLGAMTGFQPPPSRLPNLTPPANRPVGSFFGDKGNIPSAPIVEKRDISG